MASRSRNLLEVPRDLVYVIACRIPPDCRAQPGCSITFVNLARAERARRLPRMNRTIRPLIVTRSPPWGTAERVRPRQRPAKARRYGDVAARPSELLPSHIPASHTGLDNETAASLCPTSRAAARAVGAVWREVHQAVHGQLSPIGDAIKRHFKKRGTSHGKAPPMDVARASADSWRFSRLGLEDRGPRHDPATRQCPGVIDERAGACVQASKPATPHAPISTAWRTAAG